MKFSSLVVLLLLVSLFSSSLGKKPSKQQKKNLKKFNKLAKKAEDYEKSLTALMTRLDAANKTASVSTRCREDYITSADLPTPQARQGDGRSHRGGRHLPRKPVRGLCK